MAYFDQEISFLVWLPEPLPQDVLMDHRIHLLGAELELEAEESDAGSSCGYIVRDWFGPFLFSSGRRFMRGRC
jgi:hypothetical protein